MRSLWFAGIALAVACDSGAGLSSPGGPIATPTSSSSSGGPSKPGELPDDDGGGGTETPDPEGWGDPKTVRRPGKLRLEQLNVRRFFDTVCDSGAGTCPTDFEEQATQEAFDKRVNQLADGFIKVQADVITLAEVEKQDCLVAVQKALKDKGFEYTVAYVAETGGKGSVDTAVLARGKLDSVVNHRNEDPLPNGAGKFTREFPEVHLTLGQNKVIVFAGHFKSKSSPDDPERRLGEAQNAHAIMTAVSAANKDALVLFGGDLNDVPDSPPLKALEDDKKLLRVASDVASQGTYRFGGDDQPIDHLFVSKEHQDAYIAKSTTIVRDSTSSKGFAGSDHATIWADFTLP